MQTSFSVVGNADVHREMQTSFSVVKMVLYRSEGRRGNTVRGSLFSFYLSWDLTWENVPQCCSIFFNFVGHLGVGLVG